MEIRSEAGGFVPVFEEVGGLPPGTMLWGLHPQVQVLGLPDRIRRRIRGIDPETGCWIWDSSAHAFGYGQLWKVDTAGRRRRHYAHRLVREFFYGPLPSAVIIRHTCDQPLCVNPAHLDIGMRHHNVVDCLERGRFCRGQDRSQAKLNDAGVRLIRRLIARGWSNKQIAPRFGVRPSTIHAVRAGRTWTHVQ